MGGIHKEMLLSVVRWAGESICQEGGNVHFPYYPTTVRSMFNIYTPVLCKVLLAYYNTNSYEQREWYCDFFVVFCRRSRRGGGCTSVTRGPTCWSPPPYRSWPSRTRRRSVLVPLNFYVELLRFNLFNVI